MSGFAILVNRFKRRRAEESGFALIDIAIVMSVILLLAVASSIAYGGIINNAYMKTTAQEVENAYTVIYEAYSRASEGVEDKEELKEILSEATKKYETSVKENNIEVRSSLIDHETIVVRVTKKFNTASDAKQKPVTYEARFTTGDDSPTLKKVTDKPINDNGIYDFGLSSKS